MANHARGLWGYWGTTAAGEELTIQATGVGGPSVAVVLEELIELGVRRAIRIGTCRALRDDLALGRLVTAGAAIAADGASVSLGAPAQAAPDPALAASLRNGGDGPAAVTLVSTDLYYDPDGAARHRAWLEQGAAALDMGTAAALTLGRQREIAVASALVISTDAGGATLSDEEINVACLELGRMGARALGAVARQPAEPQT